MYGNGAIRLQQVRKWCRVFKSGWTDIMMVTSVGPANKEELILENLPVTIQDLSTAMEVPM
jgi:hypothetical protein